MKTLLAMGLVILVLVLSGCNIGMVEEFGDDSVAAQITFEIISTEIIDFETMMLTYTAENTGTAHIDFFEVWFMVKGADGNTVDSTVGFDLAVGMTETHEAEFDWDLGIIEDVSVIKSWIATSN